MALHADDLVDPAGVTDELLCSICTGVFLDPQACPCGHTFCCFCIEQWLRRNGRCPLCRAEVKGAALVESAALRAECDSLTVRCPSRCGWQGRRDEQAEHMAACPAALSVDNTITIDGPLGICYEILENYMLVGSVREGWAAWEHNKAHEGCESRMIHVNDQVVMINGIRGDPALLAHLLKKPARKTVTFRQPEEFAINVNKAGKRLGIDLSWSKPNGILTVVGVDSGAVEENNRSVDSPSKQLLRHDRIIEVNGVNCMGKADSAVPMLRDGEEFVIRFHRQRTE